MTLASKQLHTYISATYDRVRLSRNACRYTAGGSISQHSAYGGPEPFWSNANDILPPTDLTTEERKAYLDDIYAYLVDRRFEWSIRLLLWEVPDHYGHIHVDHYPAIVWPDRWCGDRNTIPKWRFSHGAYLWSNNPMPENGLYDGSEGDDMATFASLAAEEFDMWSDKNVVDAFDAGMFDSTDREGFLNYWTGPSRGTIPAEEKARFIADYRAHLWRRT